ncbi:hypothetical protein BPORC_0199 [Bifidobacterium porcinum]|nr:hypothetical protein BPORC_0199 [Bifidobacterium porcinum]
MKGPRCGMSPRRGLLRCLRLGCMCEGRRARIQSHNGQVGCHISRFRGLYARRARIRSHSRGQTAWQQSLPSRPPSCEDSLTQRPVDDTKPVIQHRPTLSVRESTHTQTHQATETCRSARTSTNHARVRSHNDQLTTPNRPHHSPPTSSASPNISRNRRIAGDVQSNISISPRQAAIPRDTEIHRPAHSTHESPKTAKSSRFQVCGNQTDYTQSLNISPEHPVPQRFSEKHPDILSFAAPRERY